MLEVVLSKTAQNELESAHRWWATNRSREQADHWYNGFLRTSPELTSRFDMKGGWDRPTGAPSERAVWGLRSEDSAATPATLFRGLLREVIPGLFLTTLLRLESSPERYAVAPENDDFLDEIRQLNYGIDRKSTHRAVFTIQANCVIILRIRHLAQESLTPWDD